MSDQRERPTFWQVIQSVLASMFGVQSDKARRRDFQYGQPWHYLGVGLVMVTLFVLFLIGMVKAVMFFVKI